VVTNCTVLPISYMLVSMSLLIVNCCYSGFLISSLAEVYKCRTFNLAWNMLDLKSDSNQRLTTVYSDNTLCDSDKLITYSTLVVIPYTVEKEQVSSCELQEDSPSSLSAGRGTAALTHLDCPPAYITPQFYLSQLKATAE